MIASKVVSKKRCDRLRELQCERFSIETQQAVVF
jgi:hypothetical protein